MGTAIGIYDVVKDYGNLRALDSMTLEIPQGAFFGLLGPNGAGKTTLISCIVGLARPTTGLVKVMGTDVRLDPLAAKRRIGFAPQEVNVEYFFPLHRILEFQGGYFGLRPATSRARVEELLTRFNLWDKRDVQYFRLSGGMKRRVMIVRALMGHPQVLILDEPTAGVDVEQRRELWTVLRELKAQGTTILLTTHYIDEAEALCETVGVIDHGKIVELGSPRDLITKYCDRRVVVDLCLPMTLAQFAGIDATITLANNGHRICATPDASHRIGSVVEALMRVITSHNDGQRICDMNVEGGDLEEVFVHMTGRRIDAA